MDAETTARIRELTEQITDAQKRMQVVDKGQDLEGARSDNTRLMNHIAELKDERQRLLDQEKE